MAPGATAALALLVWVAGLFGEAACASGSDGGGNGGVAVLHAHELEATLSQCKVSLVEFVDSSCHNCGAMHDGVLRSAHSLLEHVATSPGGPPDSKFGVFRVDLAHSEQDHRAGMRYGAEKGRATRRVFRGKHYAQTYKGGLRAVDIADFLVAVRDGKPIPHPNELRPAPVRHHAISYADATARGPTATGGGAGARAAAATASVAADGSASVVTPGEPLTSYGDPAATGGMGPQNYTVEAQRLIDGDDPLFVPKDPRHLGLYEYAAWHNHQVARVKDPNDPALDVKFIVFQELAKVLGFGNQVEGLLSTLMFAMMTRRVFVVDWGRDHNGVDPQELFQDLPLDCELATFLPHFATVMDDNHLRTLQRRNFDPRNPNDGCMVPSPDWVCADLDRMYADPVIMLKGNIYSGHILSYNPHYQDVYTFLFGERGLHNNPYASLFKWFLRPLPYILERMEQFKAANFAPAGNPEMRTVGIHMRVRDSFLKEQSVPFFWECAQSNFRLNNTVFYLATDNPVVQEDARTQLAPGTVTWYKQIDGNKQGLRRDAEHRLLDLLLLGECDDLVVTCGSSYSRVAFSRGDIAPLFVTFQSHRWSLRHQPHQCLRAATAKPCAARYLNQIDKATCLEGASPELLEEIYLECDVS